MTKVKGKEYPAPTPERLHALRLSKESTLTEPVERVPWQEMALIVQLTKEE